MPRDVCPITSGQYARLRHLLEFEFRPIRNITHPHLENLKVGMLRFRSRWLHFVQFSVVPYGWRT